jgi:hypothetical protein
MSNMEIDKSLLVELYGLTYTRVNGMTECVFCGEQGNTSIKIEHGICGNDPCPAGLVRDILWRG